MIGTMRTLLSWLTLAVVLPFFVVSYTGAFVLALVSRRAANPWTWPSFATGLAVWGLLIAGTVWAIEHVSIAITLR